MTRKEFWEHLLKVYREVYPDPDSPTGTILVFGLVAEEPYERSDAPSLPCKTHKHAPTLSNAQHYWNKIASHWWTKYSVKLNAVAHDCYADM